MPNYRCALNTTRMLAAGIVCLLTAPQADSQILGLPEINFVSGGHYVLNVSDNVANAGSSDFELGVPIGGFTPYVGLGLTDHFLTTEDSANFILAEVEQNGVVGNWLGAGGGNFEYALYDSGAAVTLLSAGARQRFGVVDAGFEGGNVITIGGASGTEEGIVEDPMSVFVTGAGQRIGTDRAAFNESSFQGLSNASIVSAPPNSLLPNVVGLPVLSQFASHIRNDRPQIFRHDGATIRTPDIELTPLGTGSLNSNGMMRASLELLQGGAFIEPLAYVPDLNIDIDPNDPFNLDFQFHDDPATPTIVGFSAGAQAAMFIRTDLANDGSAQQDVMMMFDTGASVSIVSTRIADRLGFDAGIDEPDFTVTVLGAGGVTEAPGFIADELSIVVEGGEFTLHNVPLLAFNLPNPASQGSTLDGLIGTNLFNGRNLILDPEPIISGGGSGPSLYISDPITEEHIWTSSSASSNFMSFSNWRANGSPGPLWDAQLHAAAFSDQQAVLSTEAQVHQLSVRGKDDGTTMELRVDQDATLWVFGNADVEQFGRIILNGGVLDAQNVDLRTNATFSGVGSVRAEFENRFGIVAPGDPVGELVVEGIFANRGDGTIAIDLAGTTPVTQHDVLTIDGDGILGGTLQVSLADIGSGMFQPEVGDQFEVIRAIDGGELTGFFDELQLPSSYDWEIFYFNDAVQLEVLSVLDLLNGDFDGDGFVGQGDIDLVLLNWGADVSAGPPVGWTTNLPTGSVDQDELDAVLLNWGSSQLGQLSVAGGVPEPGTLVLILLLSAGLLFGGGRLIARS